MSTETSPLQASPPVPARVRRIARILDGMAIAAVLLLLAAGGWLTSALTVSDASSDGSGPRLAATARITALLGPDGIPAHAKRLRADPIAASQAVEAAVDQARDAVAVLRRDAGRDRRAGAALDIVETHLRRVELSARGMAEPPPEPRLKKALAVLDERVSVAAGPREARASGLGSPPVLATMLAASLAAACAILSIGWHRFAAASLLPIPVSPLSPLSPATPSALARGALDDGVLFDGSPEPRPNERSRSAALDLSSRQGPGATPHADRWPDEPGSREIASLPADRTFPAAPGPAPAPAEGSAELSWGGSTHPALPAAPKRRWMPSGDPAQIDSGPSPAGSPTGWPVSTATDGASPPAKPENGPAPDPALASTVGRAAGDPDPARASGASIPASRSPMAIATLQLSDLGAQPEADASTGPHTEPGSRGRSTSRPSPGSSTDSTPEMPDPVSAAESSIIDPVAQQPTRASSSAEPTSPSLASPAAFPDDLPDALLHLDAEFDEPAVSDRAGILARSAGADTSVDARTEESASSVLLVQPGPTRDLPSLGILLPDPPQSPREHGNAPDTPQPWASDGRRASDASHASSASRDGLSLRSGGAVTGQGGEAAPGRARADEPMRQAKDGAVAAEPPMPVELPARVPRTEATSPMHDPAPLPGLTPLDRARLPFPSTPGLDAVEPGDARNRGDTASSSPPPDVQRMPGDADVVATKVTPHTDGAAGRTRDLASAADPTVTGAQLSFRRIRPGAPVAASIEPPNDGGIVMEAAGTSPLPDGPARAAPRPGKSPSPARQETPIQPAVESTRRESSANGAVAPSEVPRAAFVEPRTKPGLLSRAGDIGVPLNGGTAGPISESPGNSAPVRRTTVGGEPSPAVAAGSTVRPRSAAVSKSGPEAEVAATRASGATPANAPLQSSAVASMPVRAVDGPDASLRGGTGAASAGLQLRAELATTLEAVIRSRREPLADRESRAKLAALVEALVDRLAGPAA